MQPYRLVQVDHRLSGDLARVAVVAGEPADYRTVLLLDPCLVVLAVGPGAGELDSPVGTVLHQGLVDKDAVVVRIDPEDRERQLPGDGLQALDHQGLLPGQQGNCLRPSRADVGGHQAVDKGTR